MSSQLHEAQQDINDQNIDQTDLRLQHSPSSKTENRTEMRKKNSNKCQEVKKKETQKLRAIIEKRKVIKIKNQFISKLKLLVPYRNVPPKILVLRTESSNLLDLMTEYLNQKQGIKLGAGLTLLWKLVSFLNIIAMLVIISFMVSFEQENIHEKFNNIVYLFIAMNFIDITMNLTVQKTENHRNIKTILAIWKTYILSDLILDIPTLILSVVFAYDYFRQTAIISLVVILLKLWRSIQREHIYVTNIYYEKYLVILRVFLFNFIIAHLIATAALLMSRCNNQVNWIKQKGIQNADWGDRYIWAYYWAVNIMLTVGFGDISATNKTQALVLIFVETISCIILAYNINVVGSILTDMKEKERERKSQLRILLKMAEQNQMKGDIVEEATKFVDESFKIKERFCYQDHDSIIETLPKTLQPEYRKQINKKMMLELPLINFFSHKSLLKISEVINRKLAHPEEIIWKKNDPSRLIVLNKGKVGLAYRRGTSPLNGKIIEYLEVNAKESRMLTMNFFKNERLFYDVKSVNYSVLYHLSTEQFATALTEKHSDYEYFCVLRDREEYRILESDLYECSLCPRQKHNLFECSKMHLVLMKTHVIAKEMQKTKKSRQNRENSYTRYRRPSQFLKGYKQLKIEQESYINIGTMAKPSTNQTKQVLVTSHDLIYSEKVTTSMRSNFVREMEMERINNIFAAKLNEQEMCVGFWNVDCDLGFNWKFYFKSQNPEGLNVGPILPVGAVRNKFIRMNSTQLESFFTK